MILIDVGCCIIFNCTCLIIFRLNIDMYLIYCVLFIFVLKKIEIWYWIKKFGLKIDNIVYFEKKYIKNIIKILFYFKNNNMYYILK